MKLKIKFYFRPSVLKRMKINAAFPKTWKILIVKYLLSAIHWTRKLNICSNPKSKLVISCSVFCTDSETSFRFSPVRLDFQVFAYLNLCKFWNLCRIAWKFKAWSIFRLTFLVLPYDYWPAYFTKMLYLRLYWHATEKICA